MKTDLENTDPNLDEKEIMSMTKKQFKTHIKPFIYQSALKEFKTTNKINIQR